MELSFSIVYWSYLVYKMGTVACELLMAVNKTKLSYIHDIKLKKSYLYKHILLILSLLRLMLYENRCNNRFAAI